MSITVVAQLETRDVSIDLEVAEGLTTAVLGGNGAGKSTLLDVIAGLVMPDAGRVSVGERLLTHIGPGTRLQVPPHQRRVALLAQRPLLFPHLNVRDNVGFAPRSRGLSRRAARSVADRWLAAVQAQDWADRRPAQLSGGQAQRVALARALAGEPQVLLLDEPLAALDVETATEMRDLLRNVLQGRTAVLVTHEATDAAVLADDAVVMAAGRVVDTGTVASLMRWPRHEFTARLWGLNLVAGTACGPDQLTTGIAILRGDTHTPLQPGGAAFAAFAPETVVVTEPTAPPVAGRNRLSLPLDSVLAHGHLLRVRAGGVEAHVPAVHGRRLPAPGTVIALDFPTGATQIYPGRPQRA